MNGFQPGWIVLRSVLQQPDTVAGDERSAGCAGERTVQQRDIARRRVTQAQVVIRWHQRKPSRCGSGAGGRVYTACATVLFS